jgi:rod shape-determining protein MreC
MRILFKRYQSILIPLPLLILSVLILSLNKDRSWDVNPVQKIILELSAPVQWLITSSARGIQSVWENYINLVDLKRENFLLRERIRELQAINTKYLELSIANERLRQMMKFKEEHPFQMVAAEVIGEDVSWSSKTIIINKGSDDGIEKRMAVLTHEGVVGQVIQTSKRVSKVLLIIDRNSSIDVMVQRTRSRGILEGRRLDTCELKYISRNEDVREGDRIISSGIGGVYPKGVMVGFVKMVEKGKYGIFQRVIVSPSVDFSRIEEVFVVKGFPNKDL